MGIKFPHCALYILLHNFYFWLSSTLRPLIFPVILASIWHLCSRLRERFINLKHYIYLKKNPGKPQDNLTNISGTFPKTRKITIMKTHLTWHDGTFDAIHALYIRVQNPVSYRRCSVCYTLLCFSPYTHMHIDMYLFVWLWNLKWVIAGAKTFFHMTGHAWRRAVFLVRCKRGSVCGESEGVIGGDVWNKWWHDKLLLFYRFNRTVVTLKDV